MAERPVEVRTRSRILVVDDEPGTAEVIRKWFTGQPYDILAASRGEDGLRMAAEGNPDIILLDIMMPGMDGHEVARRLKGDPATKGIPIILVTARKETVHKVQAFDADVDDYITKPFEFEEIDARIRSMLRKRLLYKELEEQTVVDDKTGIANYRHFVRRLGEEWLRAQRYGTPLSLVMLDLDNFKRVNDTHGHPAGDRVLKEFAMLVTGGARATDLAARFGGEEFAIILPHTDKAMATRVAERILSGVQDFVFLSPDAPTRLTVSAGVATYPSSPDIDSHDALVRAADRALYRAKSEGKNRVVADDGSAGSTRKGR